MYLETIDTGASSWLFYFCILILAWYKNENNVYVKFVLHILTEDCITSRRWCCWPLSIMGARSGPAVEVHTWRQILGRGMCAWVSPINGTPWKLKFKVTEILRLLFFSNLDVGHHSLLVVVLSHMLSFKFLYLPCCFVNRVTAFMFIGLCIILIVE